MGSYGQCVPHGLADDHQWEMAGILESCFLSCLPPNYLFCHHRWLCSACVFSTIAMEPPPAGSTRPAALSPASAEWRWNEMLKSSHAALHEEIKTVLKISHSTTAISGMKFKTGTHFFSCTSKGLFLPIIVIYLIGRCRSKVPLSDRHWTRTSC